MHTTAHNYVPLLKYFNVFLRINGFLTRLEVDDFIQDLEPEKEFDFFNSNASSWIRYIWFNQESLKIRPLTINECPLPIMLMKITPLEASIGT